MTRTIAPRKNRRASRRATDCASRPDSATCSSPNTMLVATSAPRHPTASRKHREEIAAEQQLLAKSCGRKIAAALRECRAAPASRRRRTRRCSSARRRAAARRNADRDRAERAHHSTRQLRTRGCAIQAHVAPSLRDRPTCSITRRSRRAAQATGAHVLERRAPRNAGPPGRDASTSARSHDEDAARDRARHEDEDDATAPGGAAPASKQRRRARTPCDSISSARSTLSATASPPPRQSVASPVRASRSCIAYSSVVEHARAARADRMTERDRAAVHVHAIPVPAECRAVRERLRRERLVRLDEIVVADLRARSSSSDSSPP